MSRFKLSPKALALVSSVLVLSLSSGYIALAWTEPAGTMPVTVAAPLNTGGVAQTKTGALALTGNLTAPIFYDADDPASTYYVNPSGQTVLAGLGVNGDIVLGGYNEKFVFHPRTGTGDFLQITNQNAGGGWLWGQGITLRDSGEVGIGTIIPYSTFNIAGSGTNVSNKGIIVGTIGDSIATSVPLLGEVGRFEIGFPGWRDMEPLQIGAKIAAVRKNVYQPNSALVQGTDLAFYTGAGSTGTNPAFHDTSSEKMRITYDGKVVIDNGGQLCIGSACAASSTWATMVSSASTGGGKGTVVVPLNLYDTTHYPYDKLVTSYDLSLNPSSNRLTAVGIGDQRSCRKIFTLQANLFNSQVSDKGCNDSIISSVSIGNYYCSMNYGLSPVASCSDDHYNVIVQLCRDNDYYCYQHAGTLVLANSSTYTPAYARTDGTFLYIFSTDKTYSWKINLSPGAVVDYGLNKPWPTVNGINLADLGSKIPYGNVIYQVDAEAQYSGMDCGYNCSSITMIGYSSLLFNPIGSY